uniref:Putative YopX protein n=1 Tax=viral metagenome TaxID=1070528 RepID=A0A6M3JM35_9ZZZZ
MREIKFRAWDNERMWYGDELRYYHLFPTQHPESNMVWMQYTGLKDKQGKEIYEGDIISFFNYNELPKIGRIIYSGCKYSIEYEEDLIDLEFFWHIQGIEVIGNIYENPELIIIQNQRG